MLNLERKADMQHLMPVIVGAMLASSASAADKSLVWPQFRGPNCSGVADKEKPPVEIGPDKNLKWKVPAPGGNNLTQPC